MTDRKNLRDLLTRRVALGDGAMGTMLYQAGIFLNSCFDELNLTNPALVAKVHTAYVQAGVDFIETNTFGANEFKLAKYGLADKVEQINTAAVDIARKSAGEEVMVAGAIGPLGCQIGPYSRVAELDAAKAFKTQAAALIKAGVDFILLETFTDDDEILIALNAVSELSDIPVVAQMTTDENYETVYGKKIADVIARISSHKAVTAVGLNCSIGPSEMLAALEMIRAVTDKPISVQPNAGLPRDVDGRTLYMCTPEYMAEYAKRFFEKGAKIIGGCCGTTPDHIRQMVRAVRSLDKATIQRPAAKISVTPTKPAPEQKAVPLAEKSKLGKKIAEGKKVYTIELVPPRGTDISEVIQKVKLCADFGMDAINIPDGPRASSRLSPMITAIKIQASADIEAILHVCCRDRNIIGMQSDMLGAHAIGLRNVLLITGDPPKLGEYPDATAVYDLDSIALTHVVSNLNRGLDIAGNPFSPPTALTISVGANPVAVDMPREIDRFKQKVRAGAEYALTQPVFDEKTLFDFLDAVRSFKIPVIAGIWPFTSYKNAEFMANEVPGVVVPEKLLNRMSDAKTREQSRKIGIEIAREMMEKIADRVAGFAISAPFGNVRTALAVLGKIAPEEI